MNKGNDIWRSLILVTLLNNELFKDQHIKASIIKLLIHYPANDGNVSAGSSNYLEKLTILLLNEVDCLTCITPLMSVNSRNTFIQMAGIQGFEHFLILQGLNDRLISIPNVLLKSLIMLLLHLTFTFTGIC